MPRLPTPCPNCGKLGVRPAGSLCQSCFLAARSAARPRCCDCGKEMRMGRERCQSCWRKQRRAEGGIGSGGAQRVDTCVCGGEKLARSPRCEVCRREAQAQTMRERNAQRMAGRPAPVPAAPKPKPKPAPAPKAPRTPSPSLDRVTRLARAIARSEAPDEEKINARLTLLKMMKRRFDRRQGRPT